MMTQSQEWLRIANDISAQSAPLYDELIDIRYDLDMLNAQERHAREQYEKSYKRELAARRTNVVVPRMTKPNPVPNAQNKRWRTILDRVTEHPYYHCGDRNWSAREWRLRATMLKQSRFIQDMMSICNTQAWNPRNPNPYLP